MGQGNTVWPGAALGGAPQDVNFDPETPGAGLEIGAGNVFREGASVHRAKTESPTRIGDENYFMAGAHAGHDSVMGCMNQLANGALLAGHATVGDRVIFGGNAGVHQFTRIGTGAFLRGTAGASMDVPPWCIVHEVNRIAGLNLIGMRRSGMPADELRRRREVFRIMYRQGLSMPSVVAQLRADGDAVGVELADFIESSKRGVCSGRSKR
jgi:UDP-N-acetylglucosamine acyltransferase